MKRLECCGEVLWEKMDEERRRGREESKQDLHLRRSVRGGARQHSIACSFGRHDAVAKSGPNHDTMGRPKVHHQIQPHVLLESLVGVLHGCCSKQAPITVFVSFQHVDITCCSLLETR
jgi:hypothetical protein